MSSILEGADRAYLREYEESEDERRLNALQDSLGSIRQTTKGGKYLGDDVIEIMIAIQGFAEQLGIDPKELDYAEDKVREAQNNLESAIYGLEEPFTDMISALQSRIDDARMDAEDDLEEGQRCWKGYEKKGTKKMFGKTVNNCVKADESTDKDLKEFQRGSFDDDKPKRPSKGKLVTKDGMSVTLPLRTQDFRGDEMVIVDYIPPHKPSSTGRIITDGGMTYFPSVADLKIIGHQFDVDEAMSEAMDIPDQDAFDNIFKDRKDKPRKPKHYDNHPTKRSPRYYDSHKDDFKRREMEYELRDEPDDMGKIMSKPSTGYNFESSKKSSIGKVMEMYDDIVYLMYIDGKLAFPTPIEKSEMNQYERAIKVGYPDADVQFKGRPRGHYSAEELAEGKGNIRKALAGIILLGGLLGLNHHQAQKVYDQSHQLQQLTQMYMVAKDRGDEAKMKDVKRRIGNHKMRLDLGKGDVDFDGRPGKDDIKDIDYINSIEEK